MDGRIIHDFVNVTPNLWMEAGTEKCGDGKVGWSLSGTGTRVAGPCPMQRWACVRGCWPGHLYYLYRYIDMFAKNEIFKMAGAARQFKFGR
jgi:hypothetical protein